MCTHLAKIIKSSLVTGYYPDIVIIAKVTPLHKAVLTKMQKITDPISVLPPLKKCLNPLFRKD